MSRTNKTIANINNPLNQDKKTLLDNFVVRHKEFNKIFRDLKNSKLNQTSQNFLIQGQRGSGKTTLLAKLRYEIEDSKNLSHLLVIQFTEEQYNIFSLNRLWETVADILEEINGFENIVEEMEEFDDEDDFYSLLKKYLNKNKKKLVLLIDNFGDILDKLKEKEHKKLRDILHESDLQIIAGSTRTLETAYKHDKPFFLAVGFKRPHLPFAAPKKYWDLYKREDVKLAEYQKPVNDGVDIAYHNHGELLSYTDIPPLESFSDIFTELIDDDQQRELIHGYYASVSFIDAQVGRIMAMLKELGLEENTTVICVGLLPLGAYPSAGFI